MTGDVRLKLVRRNHPKFLNGEKTEEQIFHEFLRTFDSPSGDGKVSVLCHGIYIFPSTFNLFFKVFFFYKR
jgi:hypothetical protein